MLRIPVPVTFNPGQGWIILTRLDFKEPRRAGDPGANALPGTEGQRQLKLVSCHTGRAWAWAPSLCHIPRGKWCLGPRALSMQQLGGQDQEEGRDHHCFLLAPTLSPGQPQLPCCLRCPPLTSLDSLPPAVAAPLLCQLSGNPSLGFSQPDFYRLDSPMCSGSLPSAPTEERQAHAVLGNVPFSINALFKTVRAALVENTPCA